MENNNRLEIIYEKDTDKLKNDNGEFLEANFSEKIIKAKDSEYCNFSEKHQIYCILLLILIIVALLIVLINTFY